jgi:hypothetical protein
MHVQHARQNPRSSRGLSRFVLVCLGLPWFVVVCRGLSWFVVVCLGLSWFFIPSPRMLCPLSKHCNLLVKAIMPLLQWVTAHSPGLRQVAGQAQHRALVQVQLK